MDSERLTRYVAGESDANERAAVEAWVLAAPENQRELEALRGTWDLTAEGTSAPAIDVDAAWARVRERMEQGGGRTIPIDRSPGWARWLAVAAILAGVVFAARLYFAPDVKEYTAAAQHLEAALDDGSKAVVAPGSSITASMGDGRNVVLKGGAYFEVRRDAAKPFVVDAGAVRITVLGTAFEVTAYDTAEAVLVRVREGHVRVAGGSEVLELTAGQQARFDRSSGSMVRQDARATEIWAGRVIQFDHASLAQVAVELEVLFDVRIELANEALSRCELTATFDEDPIADVLRVIADTFGLTVEETGPQHYKLQGNGC